MVLWDIVPVGTEDATFATSVALVGVAIAVALSAVTVELAITAAGGIAAMSAGVLVRHTASSAVADSGTVIGTVPCLDTHRSRGDGPGQQVPRRTDRRALLCRAGLLVVTVFVLSSALAVTTVSVSENADFERTVTDIAAETDAHVLSVEISYRRDLLLRHPSTVTVRLVGGSRETAVQLRTRITAETGQDVAVTVIHEDGAASRL